MKLKAALIVDFIFFIFLKVLLVQYRILPTKTSYSFFGLGLSYKSCLTSLGKAYCPNRYLKGIPRLPGTRTIEIVGNGTSRKEETPDIAS